MSINISRLLGFRDFFPNEEPRDKKFYANKLGKKFLLKLACHFLSYWKFNQDTSVESLLKDFFTYYDYTYEKSISYFEVIKSYERIKNHNENTHFEIFCIESFLKLYLYVSQEKGIVQEVTV